jgi:hypothetical protein
MPAVLPVAALTGGRVMSRKHAMAGLGTVAVILIVVLLLWY